MAATSTAFTRAQRLTTSAQFSRVFASGSRSVDRFFTVLALSNDQPTPRLGLAISKRVAPRAVDRNMLRRQVREAFRHMQPVSLDFVVMARRDATGAPRDKLRSSLDRHFGRLSKRSSSGPASDS